MSEMFSKSTSKINIEVKGADGKWHSFHNPPRYRLSVDGFGIVAHSKARKTVSSDFFAGEFTISERDNNQARQLSIYSMAGDVYELRRLEQNILSLFGQNPFQIRTTVYEDQTVETSSGSADITIDGSHVYLHNTMSVARVTFNVLPTALKREEMEWLSPWMA